MKKNLTRQGRAKQLRNLIRPILNAIAAAYEIDSKGRSSKLVSKILDHEYPSQESKL